MLWEMAQPLNVGLISFLLDKKLGWIMKLDEEAYIKEKSIRFVALTYLIPNKQHGDEIGAKIHTNGMK